MELNELEPVFAALREGGEGVLAGALAETMQLAHSKGMDSKAYGEALKDAGIEFTPAFGEWIEAKFNKKGN